jgi:Ca-activated chloride channel family protein
MKEIAPILGLCFSVFTVHGQYINAHVRQGNSLYKQKKFEEALKEYQQSLATGSADLVTNYNFGNALFRTDKFEPAAETFEKIATQSEDVEMKQRAYYNQGVSFSKQQKLEQSIEAYKRAVLLNPADQDARVNLQKALLEQKKKQPPQPKKDDDKKKQQNKKEQQQQKPQSNLTKKQVEQLLRALQQREQQVQQKMQQNRNRTAGQQEKDW